MPLLSAGFSARRSWFRRNVNHLPFKINDLEFSDTSQIIKNKVSKIDITDYLQDGINTVDFEPLTKENKGKYAIYRVEFL